MNDELRLLRAAVAALGHEKLDWHFKAVPAVADGCTASEFLARGARLSDFATPLMTLDSDAIASNLGAMATWCAERGLALAPHGKTTMAPALFLAQLEAGAWGITLANEPQVRAGRGFGLPRIHLANPLLRPAGLTWLAREQTQDPTFRFSSWVDSVQAVDLMTAGLPAGSSVDVCVELGAPGGRTGARGLPAAIAVAEAVSASPRLRLIGVSGYEGAVAHGTDADQLAAVDRYLDDVALLHAAVGSMYDLTTARTAMVTVGGSAYFDQVATRLGPLVSAGTPTGPATEVVIRSGAYLVHDDGFYRSITPSNRSAGPALRSAMHAWARVISQPEPGLALLDVGRRDVPFDQGYPEPQQRLRSGAPTTSLVGATIRGLDDQHAFLELRDGDDVAVGDVVRLGLSHPCTAFDKWTLIPMIQDASADDPKLLGLIRTYF